MSVTILKRRELGFEVYIVQVNGVLTLKAWSLNGALSVAKQKYPGATIYNQIDT